MRPIPSSAGGCFGTRASFHSRCHRAGRRAAHRSRPRGQHSWNQKGLTPFPGGEVSLLDTRNFSPDRRMRCLKGFGLPSNPQGFAARPPNASHGRRANRPPRFDIPPLTEVQRMASPDGPDTSPRRVLIVEDELMIRMLLEDMLIDLGYAVASSTGRLDEAIAIARDGDFDIASST